MVPTRAEPALAARHFKDLLGRKFMNGHGHYGLEFLPRWVKIAAPDRQVVAVTGDGGFQMSLSSWEP